MRSLLTRLAALGVIVAITGCAGPNTPVAVAGSPNNGQASGGNPQPNVTGPGGTGGVTPAANTIAPLLIDNGTLGAARPQATYIGFNVNAVDSQSAVQSPQDASPAAPAPTVPPNPNSAADLGSHSVVITSMTQSQALITSNQTYNLTYTFGGQTFDYSTLVAHFAVTAGSVPTSVSAEYVSNTLTTAGFDVRTACAPAAVTATFARFTCPIPAFDTIPAANTSGPNVVNPNASDVFVPTAAKIYFVLNYAQPPGLAATTTFGIDNVYAIQ